MFDHEKVAELRPLLQKWAKETYGEDCVLELGTLKFNANQVSGRITISMKDSEGVPSAFSRLAPSMGLKSSDYQRLFKVSGSMYRVVGINPRAKKYPILAQKHDGEKFKFAVDTVTRNWYEAPLVLS